MGKMCLKCGYERNPSDNAPDYECPQCGAIYAKVEAALKKNVNTDNRQISDQEKINAIKQKVAFERKKQNIAPPKQEAPTEVQKTNGNPKLAKCKTCGNEVSKTAKTCPHCGEKNPVPKQEIGCFSAIVIIFLVLWVIGKFSGTGNDGGSSSPRYDKFSAQVDCENFTKKRLKAPSTADFAPHRDLKISGSGAGPWTVIGYVDAQNSFGAKIRQNYICKIHYQGDTVYLDNLIIN